MRETYQKFLIWFLLFLGLIAISANAIIDFAKEQAMKHPPENYFQMQLDKKFGDTLYIYSAYNKDSLAIMLLSKDDLSFSEKLVLIEKK